jgi:AcrR family transcriptional regulator
MQNNILDRENEDPRAGAVERAVGRSLEPRREAALGEVRRLVEAAQVLIRRDGRLEPRVSEIVRAAGLSNQAFYRHFRSKHELLAAVLDDGLTRLADYLEHRMSRAPTATEAVREWVRGMLSQASNAEAAEATRPFALGRERLAEHCPAEVRESELRLTALLQGAIARAAEAGELPRAEPAADAEALYHLVMGWMQGRLRDGAATPEAAAALESFALAGLRRAGEEGA